MRFNHITTAILKEQQLAQAIAEVRMAPSNLRQFVDSPAAKGMQAGFEAEVIFRDALVDAGGYAENDYDYDTPVNDIDEIDLFFDEAGLPDNYVRRIRARIEKDYNKWLHDILKENFDDDGPENIANYMIEHGSDVLDFNPIQAVEKYLRKERYDDYDIDHIIDAAKHEHEFATRRTKFKDDEEHARWIKTYEKVLQELRDDLAFPDGLAYEAADDGPGNKLYDEAFNKFVQDFIDDNDVSELQQEFLEDGLGVSMMSQICDYYGFEWPYTTDSEESFNESVAENYAEMLNDATGWETIAYDYHGAPRPKNTWVFEPDPSIEGSSGDMGVEIVSPPMPLAETIQKMKTFFAWVESEGGYTNESTGFHMSVSMPDHDPKNVDFVKLALFLGDKHVLEEFGRMGNGYCKNAIDQLKAKGDKIDIDAALEQMRSHLIQLASKSFAGSDGFDYKYNTINPKSKYIEFRGAGGEDYFKDIEKIQSTLSRYAQAISIASDPDAYRPEYAKKFYKLIGSSMPEDANAIQLFSQYMAHEITAEELKQKLSVVRQERTLKWYQVDLVGINHDNIYYLNNLLTTHWTKPVIVVAKNTRDAIINAKKKMNEISYGSAWNYKSNDEWVVRELGPYVEGEDSPAMQTPALKLMINKLQKLAIEGNGRRWEVSYKNNKLIVRASSYLEAIKKAQKLGLAQPFSDTKDFNVVPLDGQDISKEVKTDQSDNDNKDFAALWPFPGTRRS